MADDGGGVMSLDHALRNLRHLYEQMVGGLVTDQRSAADGLLSPAIAMLEKEQRRAMRAAAVDKILNGGK